MADLKRKQLKEFLSGSFGITGSLNVTGSIEFDKDISGSITSTGSFSNIKADTLVATNTIFASGSTVQTVIDATGSYASASTTYLMESQTGLVGKILRGPHLEPSQAIFSMDRKKSKNVKILPILLGGPMGPIHPAWALAAFHPGK